ncbi:glycosyltransferase family 4 protein [Maridesulfovibrio ferrireducens]|uniref:glycosyltransferase family 4 protein n=1 Tax=Maridesulfovibrio ferrireducens TaxID=246191 RepID=UPI001A2D5F76|nr:glycosyltransferase family 4 protein [Maridesulfovibrio ferrireducens]MBI9111030.1 glycosyltransferase family 4 protein [Maridesulfovibrio ferrireducens]
MAEEKIKVLHVASSLGLGGTEKVMQSFVTNLDKGKFYTAVFSPTNGPRAKLLRDSGIETFIGLDILPLLEKFRPNVVHLHRAGWAEPGYLRPFKLARIPVIVETNVFGHHDPSPDGKIIDRHLFVSHFCAERFEKINFIPALPPKYSVLYNPVDTDFFATHSPAERNFPPHTFGRISRADPGKWSTLALGILPNLHKMVEKKELAPFSYNIIGGIPEAEKFVTENNFNKYVNFLTPILTDKELSDFFNSISFLAHANDTGESFGLVIAEAMAAGLPVITHPCKELRDNAQLELVDHGETGLIANSAQEYAEAVKLLLTHPDKAREMGENGRNKASKLFRTQDVATKLGNIYIELLESKGFQK